MPDLSSPPQSLAVRLAECWAKPVDLLVVEDNEMLCQCLQAIAKQYACRLHFAHTGEDALDMIRTLDYKAVILDLLLPGISGIDVFRHMMANQIDVPVCVMTGIPLNDKVIDELYDVGWCLFCRKPKDFTEQWFRTFFRILGIRPLSASQAA